MNKKNVDGHRPIVFEDARELLDKEEESRIREIAKQICAECKRSDSVLNSLIKEYRDIVGFENINVSFCSHLECGDGEEDREDPESWVRAARLIRKEWALETIRTELAENEDGS